MKEVFLILQYFLSLLIPSKKFFKFKAINNNLTLEEDIEIDKLKSTDELLEEK